MPNMHKIIINGTRHAMYVNPKDQRGGRMQRYKGLSQPRVTAFWQTAARLLQPSIVVDAGVNYGEILLSAQYPASADIVAVEANEELRPYLSRSLREHPNGLQARTVFAFVSDMDAQAVTFYVDKYHSGLSSGHAPAARAAKRTAVGTVTIDGLFPGRSFGQDVVLFKLDVEGFEWNALRGMSRMLGQCRAAAGCIEFNLPYMRSKGIDPEAFLRYLSERFLVCVPDKAGKPVPIEEPVYERIQKLFASNKEYNDLVLLSGKELYDKLRQA